MFEQVNSAVAAPVDYLNINGQAVVIVEQLKKQSLECDTEPPDIM